jgi:hypothetical protein
MAFTKNLKQLFWLAVGLWLLLAAGRAWSARSSQPASPLVITEFVAANATGLVDEDGDYSDWIEIYNQSNTALNLAGWSLTDDPGDL